MTLHAHTGPCIFCFYCEWISHRYCTDVQKVSFWPRLWASQSRVPLATPSHFPSDRKQGSVFLYKFRFTTGKRKSQLAKVSL